MTSNPAPLTASPASGDRIPLGIYAESAAANKINALAAAVAKTAAPVVDFDQERQRIEQRDRYRLQRAAAALLDGERVYHCTRSITGWSVDVMQDADTKRAHYSGIFTCGSRWHCPICAPKATEKSRRELQDAITLWTRQGGRVFLASFTFPHELAMPLADSVEKMQDAQRRMKASAAYKRIMRAAGALGSVKALEVTYGENGWHPHVHMLIFARPGAEEQLEAIRESWAAMVERVGLGRVNEHGFDLRGGDFAAEYVAKFGKEPGAESRQVARAWWTAAHELTKGHAKTGGLRMKGATPFTLLRWYADDDDAQAGALFAEYGKAFSGKAQLYWSRGLRQKLDLFATERTRPELAKPQRVAKLERADWHAVIRNNARWELLNVAERYGAQGVEQLLARLRLSRGRWRGDFKTSDPLNGRWLPGWWSGPVDPWEAQRTAAAA